MHPNVIYLSLLLQLKDCLSLIVHMPSEDKVKAAEVWNESSLKLQQMINDQHQVSNDNTKTFFFTTCKLLLWFRDTLHYAVWRIWRPLLSVANWIYQDYKKYCWWCPPPFPLWEIKFEKTFQVFVGNPFLGNIHDDGSNNLSFIKLMKYLPSVQNFSLESFFMRRGHKAANIFVQ